MQAVLIAALTFLAVSGVVLGIWWVVTSEQTLRARLSSRRSPGGPTAQASSTFLRSATPDGFSLLNRIATAFPWVRRVGRLADQAGWQGRSGLALGLIGVFGVLGGVIGTLRMGHWAWGIICAVTIGALPVLYLRHRRQKRLEKFSEQFPEALDMLTRSLRTGYAVVASFQMVAEEMPDPVGAEFKQVFEQMSLGRPATEALQEMYDRIGTEDVRFFYVALAIQREVGGNLAEILEKLAEVVRERYKLLAFAQTLSAQQRVAAYCVAASPFVVALLLSFTSPGWFDPMWEWAYGKHVAVGALGMQLAGFLVLRRIANITV
jgi:tight adherence protein B